MTVAEIIEELRKLPPHAPVRIAEAGWDGDELVDADVGAVTWEGNHVLLQSAT